ncbi:hypothetical protein NKG05_10325 [Oerskovia sp. M15]
MWAAILLFVVGVALVAINVIRVWADIGWWVPVGAARWWHVVPLAVGCAAMTFKRTRPVLALTIGGVAFVADAAIAGSLGMILVLWDLLYASGLYASGVPAPGSGSR